MSAKSSADIAGSITISLRPDDDLHQARIHTERPMLASRLFEGKSVTRVLHLAPLLFSVCGQAQSVAAVRAIENAMRRQAGPEVERRRDYLVALEGIREHLWRFYIDWPKLLGQRGNASQFAPINQACLSLTHALNPDKVITTVPGLRHPNQPISEDVSAQWFALKRAILSGVFSSENITVNDTKLPTSSEAAALLCQVAKQGWASLGNVELPPLFDMPEETLVRILRSHVSERFVCRPTWQGRCYETGPFARQLNSALPRAWVSQYGPGAAARIAARFTELLQMINTIDSGLKGASLLRPRAAKPALGLSQIEAARGRLIHYVELEDARVVRYRIVAPTEWNFHPDGILARILNHLPQQGEPRVRRAAELLIKLADPCVGHQLHLLTREPCHA